MFCCRQIELFGLILILNLAISEIRYVSHKNCNSVRKGTIIANPGNCSQYIMCNGLRSTIGECSEGLYFNAEMLSCDKNSQQCRLLQGALATVASENISSDPQNIESNLVITTTTSHPTTKYPVIVNRPVCSTLQDHYYPHPYNCSFYYQCVRGLLTVRKCYFGYGWDWLRQTCIPISMAFCAGQ